MRTCIVLLVGLLGCDESAKDPSQLDWQLHTLTEAQNTRQQVLLDEIAGVNFYRGDLNGKSAADYSELLSLADRTCTRGSETIYSYNVVSHGDVNQPDQMTIVVSEGKIKSAYWPVYDY
jgi:hypothetical protein